MKIAIIGLGKMGANMARRLRQAGIEVVGFDRDSESTRLLEEEIEIEAAYQFEEVIHKLTTPRIIWSMVPAGETTKKIAQKFYTLLDEGDYYVDGGNSFYKDSIALATMFQKKKINFYDIGVSGGIWGLQEGYSLMIGGDREPASYLVPIFEILAPDKEKGWGFVGPHGAGHFVKMVHNGIEYGMMESLAEGFEIMKTKREFKLNLEEIAGIWQHGSVVRSWLLDLTLDALSEDKELSNIDSRVEDSGEGRWTVHEAIDLGVPAPVISASLNRRFGSRQTDSFAVKLLSAMRNKFGGHAIKE